MAETVKETILKGFQARVLTVPALQTGTRVYRSRSAAIRTSEFPCLVIRPLGDAVTMEGCVQHRAHRLTIGIEMYTQAEIPDQDLDELEDLVDAAIMQFPRSITGANIIGIEPEGTEFDVGEGDIGRTTLLYAVKYRTLLTSLSVQ